MEKMRDLSVVKSIPCRRGEVHGDVEASARVEAHYKGPCSVYKRMRWLTENTTIVTSWHNIHRSQNKLSLDTHIQAIVAPFVTRSRDAVEDHNGIA